MPDKPIRRRAFAKINLALRVVGTRPDGYHELRTVFQSIALYDTLAIRRVRGPFQLVSSDPQCAADETNLVWRAAAAAWNAAGRSGVPHGLAIRLTKRIPIQAGLGGGSSDAATTLLALARMWRVSMPVVRKIAAGLGADVSYFLEGGTALGLDRGDRIVRMPDIRRAWVVLLIPSFGVSTRDAFRWWDEQMSVNPDQRCEVVNDLQPAITAHHPEIDRLASALEKCGARVAAMTGSGSAVFGLFDRRADAAKAAAALGTRTLPAIVTRTLDRATYQRLAGIGATRS
jgi:4-diphosphocytidyl-2-C-methyl-D-erythritol kinase